MRHLFISLLLALSTHVALAAVETPDPARLNADWWTYLAPAEALDDEAMQQRAEALDGALEALRKQLETEQRDDVLPRISRLRELVAGYPAARTQKAVLRDALAPPAEAYSLEEAFARNRVLLTLNDEIGSQQDEINWRRDLLVAERRQHSRAKVAYIEQDRNDSARLEAGLTLMASRVQLEIDVLDLERRQTSLTQLLEQRAALEEEIEAIAARLDFGPSEREAWERVRQTALDEAGSFRDDEAAPAGVAGAAGTDEHRARIDALRILLRDLRVKNAELLAARAELVVNLIDSLSAGDAQTVDVERLVQEAEQELDALQPRRQYWKNAVRRVEQTLDVAGDPAASRLDLAQAEEGKRLVAAIRKANAKVGRESSQLAFAAALAERRVRLGDSAVRRGWAETLDIVRAGIQGSSGLLSESLFEINETPVTMLGLFRVVFFVTIAWLLSKLLRRGLAGLAERRANVSQSSLYTLGRVFHYVILAIGILIGLSSIGIDFTKFALLASALGIGIGFGMQALVSNFVAGLIILFEKSLKVGDFVELQSGVAGEVKEINMRSTLVTTNDNVDILVPNSDFINKEVTNWTLREAYRRIHVPFGVAYGTDKDQVRKAVLEAAANVHWTLSDSKRRAPQVWFVNFGDSSLDFELVVWLIPEAVKRPGNVQAAYLWEIDTKLREYGIEVPFPQRDLHLRSGFEDLGNPAPVDSASPSG